MNPAHDAAVHPLAPPLHARSDEAGKHLDRRALRGSQHADAVIGEISAIVECARISKIARSPQLRTETQALAIVIHAHGNRRALVVVLLRFLRVNADAHSATDLLRLLVARDFLGLDVNGLAQSPKARRASLAPMNDVRRHDHLLAGRKRQQTVVMRTTRIPRLDGERSDAKQRPQRKGKCQPPASASKVECGERKPDRNDHPPKRRPPRVNAADSARPIGQGGPEHRLARWVADVSEKRNDLLEEHGFR